MAYQAGQADAFYHRYRYDDNNRLLEAESSADGLFWSRDAYYSYYRHGPLARTEYGEKVQGLDYTYTLQGWLKGMNSDVLNEKNDPGHDGLAGTAYGGFSRDAFSFSLFYFFNDQQPVHPSFYEAYAGPANTGEELFNGNIRALTASLKKPGTGTVQPLIQEFTYDQLNRIAKSTAYDDLDLNTNTWGGVASPAYGTSYTYDPDGNLQTVTRAGDNPANYAMDNLAYQYYPHGNRLNHIKDNVPAGNYPSDINNQPGDNYGYDEIGNLISDKAEKIDTIEWTLYGKVKRVVFSNSKPDLEFTYSPNGRRLSKKIRPKDGSPVKILYYSHDAQGNVMAIYTLTDPKGPNLAFTVDEHLLYGSSRLGVRKNGTELLTYVPSSDPVKHPRGLKRYELGNHLGNVQAVVSDRRNRVCESGSFSRYEADIRNTYDYYPFGMLMPERSFEAQVCTTNTTYTPVYALNENFSGGTGGFTALNSAILSNPDNDRLNVTRKGIGTPFPSGWGAARTFTPSTGKLYTVSFLLDQGTCFAPAVGGPATIGVRIKDGSGTVVASHTYTTTGVQSFTFTPATSGTYTIEFYMVTAVYCIFYVDDVQLYYTAADTSTVCNVADDYRFGFGGQLKDNEIYGDGNAYAYEFRDYDPRTARFFSADPLFPNFPYWTPYAFAGNTPIMAIDLEGKEPKVTITGYSEKIIDGRTQVDVTASVEIKVYVVNMSSKALDTKLFTSNLNNSFKNIVSGTGYYSGSETVKYDASGLYKNTNVDLTAKITINAQFITASSLNNISAYDNAIVIVDNIPKQPDGIDPVGIAESGGRVSLIEAGLFNSDPQRKIKTPIHEILHNFTLPDLYKWDKNGNITDDGGDNIMGNRTSFKMTPQQKGEVYRNILSTDAVKKYTKRSNASHYETTTADKATSFIKSTKSKTK